jgi:hypothetical protein
MKKKAVDANFKTSFEFRPRAAGVKTNSRGSISPSRASIERTNSVEKARLDRDSYSKKETNEIIHSLSNLGASIMHQPLGSAMYMSEQRTKN